MRRAATQWLPVLLLAGLLGCDGGSSADPAVVDPAGPPTLDAAAVYTRASLDLLGVRPTLAELDALDADPARLDAMLDALIEHPRLPTQVKELFAPAFRTRVDGYPYTEAYAEQIHPLVLSRAIGEEPLNLVAWLVANDRPFTDIVLARHTVVAPALLGFWPLEVTDADDTSVPGAVVARYTDQRPMAGVLSMNAMWWRHPSTEENANRGRANALSEALLCESYLDRPIAFPREIDLTDSASIHRAIRENQACQACHSTLDPLASHLYGFLYRGEDRESWARYTPAQEREWMRTTERAPAFFGTPTTGLRDLGRQIASDERFVMCAVRRVYAGLMVRPLEITDDGALATHREAFLASGLSLKALIRSVLDDPAYRGRAARAAFGGRPAAATYTLVTPAILAHELEDLTGYRMTLEERDVLTLDFGLRAVAGGSDRGPATTPSTGLVLVQRRLAEAAASAMISGVTEGRMSALIARDDLDPPPTPETTQRLLRMATGRRVRADGPEVGALLDLWTEIDAIAGPEQAWTGLLTAILADPERLLR